MGEENPEAELADIRAALEEEHAVEHEPVFAGSIVIRCFWRLRIGMFNQLAGINAILYYVNNIFASAGFSQISSDQQSVAIGATIFTFTIVGMLLIDKLGRKTLLLIGAAGCASCLAGVSWVFATHSHQSALLPILIVYMAFFSISQGAVIWVYIGEVFPTLVRSKGQGIGSASHWFSNAIIALEFPVVVNYFHTATPFAFFAVMTVVQFVRGAVHVSRDQGADAGRFAAAPCARGLTSAVGDTAARA